MVPKGLMVPGVYLLTYSSRELVVPGVDLLTY